MQELELIARAQLKIIPKILEDNSADVIFFIIPHNPKTYLTLLRNVITPHHAYSKEEYTRVSKKYHSSMFSEFQTPD
jgi:hypothetical protein